MRFAAKSRRIEKGLDGALKRVKRLQTFLVRKRQHLQDDVGSSLERARSGLSWAKPVQARPPGLRQACLICFVLSM
jgi:hypothetical protein